MAITSGNLKWEIISSRARSTHRRLAAGAVVLCASLGLWLAMAGLAHANNLIVNSTADAVDASPGDGICATAINECTLRAAIMEANALLGADTITLPTGTYTLTIAGAGENAAATGDLDITGPLTITGAGAASTVIDGNGVVTGDRVLQILAGATVQISNVTIKGGTAPSGVSGGGVSNQGVLALSNVLITQNTAGVSGNTAGATGGGITNTSGAVLTVNSSTVSNNTALRTGGGISNSGTATLTNSTVTQNIGRGGAGGISNGSSGNLTLNASSVSDNQAQTNSGGTGNGGGLGTGGIVSINDSTISGNTAQESGGGMTAGGAVTITRSTFSANTATYGNGGGVAVGAGGTLSVTNSTFSGNSAGNSGGGLSNFSASAFSPTNSTVVLMNSTLSGNSAAYSGGGLYNGNAPGSTTSSSATVTNATIKNNTAPSGGGISNDSGNTVTLKNTIVGVCNGPITSSGNNLSNSYTCGLTSPGDIQNTDPLLGPLQNNGGSTKTHALLSGSPAIDAGDNVGCPATDQRGVARPFGVSCDIGAYEYDTPPPADTTPPVITPTLAGALGLNGWYTSDVTISWSVTDPESSITSTSGCGNSSVTADTAGATFTCTAASAGGAASNSVTVKVDKTAPQVACSATPGLLWPPNHQLVTVNAIVSVVDGTAGAAGFTLTAVASNEPDAGLGAEDVPNDIQGWTLGAADVEGQLRAERSDSGAGRTYTLTYVGADTAGNTASCNVVVAVPHDQGRN